MAEKNARLSLLFSKKHKTLEETVKVNFPSNFLISAKTFAVLRCSLLSKIKNSVNLTLCFLRKKKSYPHVEHKTSVRSLHSCQLPGR